LASIDTYGVTALYKGVIRLAKNRSVNFGLNLFILPLVLLVSMLLSGPDASADDASTVDNRAAGQSQVTLNASRVSYDDETAMAMAEGNAVLTYEGATIRADRIDYDAFSQKVKASPNPGGYVSLNALGRTVTAEGLEYNLDTGEGVLSGVRSNMPVGDGTLYVVGGGMQYMPYDLALERGLVREAKGKESGVPFVGIAENVSATTCALDHPHYRIETKSIVFVPGRRLVAKKPRLYLGNTFIFTYPMDYIVHIDRRALKHHFIPYVQSSGNKGTGAGLTGAFAWETGAVSLGLAYGSKVGFEWTAGIEQRLGGGFSVQGGIEHSWDSAWEEKRYRPRVGLLYERDGWEAALRVTWNEYLEDRKDSYYEYKGQLDRKPEFTVLTPWMKDHSLDISWFRLGATAGSYRERTPIMRSETVTRYGATLQSYFEYSLGRAVTFFSNITGGAWFYDKDNAEQEIVSGIMGFRYNLGVFELASGYERRYVWGESPMLWDEFRYARRFHQKIRFPLGKDVFLAVRGSYDMVSSAVDEVNYSLQWITDCMKWELRYRDDRTSRSENSLNLSVFFLAYPNTPVSFGEYKDNDPFELPGIPELASLSRR